MKKDILPLVVFPDHRLHKASEKVEQIDDSIRALLDKMADAVFEYNGLGISGVQLGIMKRLIVIDRSLIFERESSKEDRKRNDDALIFMVNAEILEASEEKSVLNEGCLSLPTIDVDVARPVKVKVKYMDYNGNEQIEETDHYLLSKCFQHEIDHTNGKLIIDYIASPLKKQFVVKKLKKYKKLHSDCECHNYG